MARATIKPATYVSAGGGEQVNTTTELDHFQSAANDAPVATIAIPAGDETRVNSETASDQNLPAIAGLAGGGTVVVWQSFESGSYAIYVQRYDVAGAAVGDETLVSTPSQSEEAASVAALADGGYVITWMSTGPEGTDDTGIYAQRFNASGGLVGPEFHVNTTEAGNQISPSVGALADGGYVVAWTSVGQDAEGSSIHVQRYDSLGG
ncbi:MAG TPA: hypothetical protein VES64_06920, partial [Allosphingosinicella sp.]|nr:hypothetical protein [Allosphingosinicella sp.]